MSLTVVIPSRGRPERARVAVQAARETAVLVSTSVILAVDADDPRLAEYRALHFRPFGPEVTTIVLRPSETGSLVRATNTVSMRIADAEPDAIIGNLGDDHLCRTPGWDARIAEVLRDPGIAYGDDMLQGSKLPTAPFVSAAIVNVLGWYFLPTLTHMYPDNVLRDLGDRLGRLHYLPHVVIEHVHPGAGKAEWDERYRHADASTAADRGEYMDWRRSDMAADVERVRLALHAAAV